MRHGLLVRVAVRLAVTATVCAVISTAVAFGARLNWLCDLTTHWRVQICVVTALTSIVLLLSRRWKPALLAVAVALLNVSYIVPLFYSTKKPPATESTFRVVSANVHSSNRRTDLAVEFIRNTKPDFFLVMEVDERWESALEDLQHDFNYSVIRARSDNFGIALYSRRPITSHRVEHLDDSKVPTIVATIELDGRSLNVVGTHPLPPMGRRRSELRDLHLQAIGNLIKRLPPPVMVLGDLNTSSWSPHFRDLLEKCDLRDSRRGFGVQPTWPVEPWVLRIPIDHALVSEDLAVTQRYVGPDIGSDHLPVVVEFAVLDSP